MYILERLFNNHGIVIDFVRTKWQELNISQVFLS